MEKFYKHDRLLDRLQMQFQGQPETLKKIQTVFTEVLKEEKESTGKIKNIHLLKFWVCQIFEVTPDELKADSRKRNVIILKQLFCYLAKKYFGIRYNYLDIAAVIYVAGDHTDSKRSNDKFKQLLQAKDKMATDTLNKWESGLNAKN